MMTEEEYAAHLAVIFTDERERDFYLKIVNMVQSLTDCTLIAAHTVVSPVIHQMWERVQQEKGAAIEAGKAALHIAAPEVFGVNCTEI